MFHLGLKITFAVRKVLCVLICSPNTIFSSDLTTFIAQTSFYILFGECEVALQAASATARISEFCSHVDLPIGVVCAMQVTASTKRCKNPEPAQDSQQGKK